MRSTIHVRPVKGKEGQGAWVAPDLVPLVLCGMRDKLVEGDINLVLCHIMRGKRRGAVEGGEGVVSLCDQPPACALRDCKAIFESAPGPSRL